MTYLEKYRETHTLTNERPFPEHCPYFFGYEEEWDCYRITCDECWQREVLNETN